MGSVNFTLPTLYQVNSKLLYRLQCLEGLKQTNFKKGTAQWFILPTLMNVGCCSNSNFLVFHCTAWSETFHQLTLPRSCQLAPRASPAFSLHGPPQQRIHPQKLRVSHLGLSRRRRNPHIATGLPREGLLLVKLCNRNANFFKTGDY